MAAIKRAPTMKDVAALAGVTQPTVSHVINGTASISKEVTARVFEAIDTLGYIPNALAKGLKKRSTRTVGFLIPDIGNNFYATIAKYVEKALRANEYVCFLSCTSYDAALERLYINSLIQNNVAGIIITYPLTDHSLYDYIKGYNIPFVLIDNVPDREDLVSVQVDGRVGGRLATEHLISIGRRRIAFASEPMSNHRPVFNRFEGYKQALSQAQIEFRQEFVFEEQTQYDKFEMGYNLGKRLIETSADAVYATSDSLAIGILRALNDGGVPIPGVIAVVGYDNVELSRHTTPTLTTVAQPIDRMSAKAVKMLIKMIAGEDCEHCVILEPTLKVRDSTVRAPRP